MVYHHHQQITIGITFTPAFNFSPTGVRLAEFNNLGCEFNAVLAAIAASQYDLDIDPHDLQLLKILKKRLNNFILCIFCFCFSFCLCSIGDKVQTPTTGDAAMSGLGLSSWDELSNF